MAGKGARNQRKQNRAADPKAKEEAKRLQRESKARKILFDENPAYESLSDVDQKKVEALAADLKKTMKPDQEYRNARYKKHLEKEAKEDAKYRKSSRSSDGWSMW